MNHVLENAIIVGILLAVILIPVSIVIIYSRKAHKKKISDELLKAENEL